MRSVGASVVSAVLIVGGGLLAGCGGDDTGPEDAARADVLAPDVSVPDATADAPIDASQPDAAPDGAPPDAEPPDAEPPDAEPPDAAPDAEPPDAAPPDAAGPAGIDLTFGGGGLATANFGNTSDEPWGIARQSDGKIVIVGTTEANEDTLGQYSGAMLVVRLTAGGALDTSFGVGGKTLTPVGPRAIARAVAIQPDDKIVVAGLWTDYAIGSHLVVARYLADGTPDTSFGGDGVIASVPGEGYAVAIQPDGKILVAGVGYELGVAKLMVMRFLDDGTPDPAFGTAGAVRTAIGTAAIAYAVGVQSDGKIFAAGATGTTNVDVAVARYLADGTLDTSFDVDGVVITPVGTFGEEAHALALADDGTVIIAGKTGVGSAADTGGLLVRYTATGALDPTFGGGDGIVIQETALFIDGFESLARLSGGTYVAAGNLGGGGASPQVAKYLADGAPDTSYGSAGQADPGLPVQDWLQSAVVAGDGSAVVLASRYDNLADTATITAARLSTAGAVDTTFGTSGVALVATGSAGEMATSVAVLPDGRIAAGGSGIGVSLRHGRLALHHADGSLDPGFGSGGTVVLAPLATVRGVAATAGGEIIVAGDTFSFTGWRFTVARYDTTGTLDTSFGTAGVVEDPIVAGGQGYPRAMTLDAAGNILVVGVAGTFSTVDAAVMRLLPDGSFDTTFSGDGRVTTDLGSSYDDARAIDVAPTGEIVVAGTSGTGPVILRYQADGTLDPTFDGDGKATPSVIGLIPDRVKVQADGRILVAGYRQSPMRVTLIRMTPTGTLDATFDGDGITEMNVGDPIALYGSQRRGPGLALGPGGTIVVAATQSSAAQESILLYRLLPAGGFDFTFGAAGVASITGQGNWTAFDVAAQPDGKLVVAGRGFSATGGVDFGLSRYTP